MIRSSCLNMSCVVRKSASCICENKGADQLCGNRAVDQGLCFCYTDGAICPLYKSEVQASSYLLWLYSLGCVGPGGKPRRQVLSQCDSYLYGQNIIVNIWPSANKNSSCWGQDISSSYSKSINNTRVGLRFFKTMASKENMLKISW